MKVLVIGPFPPPLHGNSFANEILYKNLKSEQIDCSFIDTSGKTISSKQGSTFSATKALDFLKKYAELSKIASHDVIYITPGHTFFGLLKYAPFISLSRFYNKPYVLHLHGNNLGNEYLNSGKIKAALMRNLIANASAGIVLSPSLKDNFNAILPDNKIHIVENFVEDQVYKISELNKPYDKLRILYLSNLMREKGIIDLLDALLILKSRGISFSATLAGTIEASVSDVVKAKIEQIGPSCNYIGTVTGKEKLKTFLDANVLVLPTYYQMEAQPISLLEGMATGNIIVTTRHAGIPEIVSENNGFFIKKKSPESIAQLFENISENVGKYVHQFSESNVDYTRRLFTEKIFANKIISILRALVPQKLTNQNQL